MTRLIHGKFILLLFLFKCHVSLYNVRQNMDFSVSKVVEAESFFESSLTYELKLWTDQWVISLYLKFFCGFFVIYFIHIISANYIHTFIFLGERNEYRANNESIYFFLKTFREVEPKLSKKDNIEPFLTFEKGEGSAQFTRMHGILRRIW